MKKWNSIKILLKLKNGNITYVSIRCLCHQSQSCAFCFTWSSVICFYHWLESTWAQFSWMDVVWTGTLSHHVRAQTRPWSPRSCVQTSETGLYWSPAVGKGPEERVILALIWWMLLTRKESSHCWVEWTVRAGDIGVIKFLTLPNKLVQIKRDTQSSLIFDHIIERMQELSETTMWICTNVPLSDWMLSLIRGEGLADRWLKGATQTTKWMQFTSLFRKKYHQG